MPDFKAIQGRFFARICKGSNPSTIKVIYLKVESTGFASFLGDSEREPDKTFELRCFYQRYSNDKQREKAGVAEDVTYSVYVSPLDLKAKTGEFDFPKQVRSSYSGVSMEFLGKHHEIESIRDLEPIQGLGEATCVAYQINLKGGKGNTDYN